MSCDVKRDLNNESNLILEEFQNLNQSTVVNVADIRGVDQELVVENHISKIKGSILNGKNELNMEKPDLYSRDQQMMENTEDH